MLGGGLGYKQRGVILAFDVPGQHPRGRQSGGGGGSSRWPRCTDAAKVLHEHAAHAIGMLPPAPPSLTPHASPRFAAVTKDAATLAEQLGVRIFTADIIYHLFDQFTAYLKTVGCCLAGWVAVWPGQRRAGRL